MICGHIVVISCRGLLVISFGCGDCAHKIQRSTRRDFCIAVCYLVQALRWMARLTPWRRYNSISISFVTFRITIPGYDTGIILSHHFTTPTTPHIVHGAIAPYEVLAIKKSPFWRSFLCASVSILTEVGFRLKFRDLLKLSRHTYESNVSTARREDSIYTSIQNQSFWIKCHFTELEHYGDSFRAVLQSVPSPVICTDRCFV